MATVKISDIVDALEMQFDERKNYLDKETGQVENISIALLRMAEGEPSEELLDSQEAEYEIAQLIVETPGRFLRLPSKLDVHDWQIMEDFANSVRKNSVRRNCFPLSGAEARSSISRM